MEARLEALQAEHRALRERSGDAAKRAAELDDEVTSPGESEYGRAKGRGNSRGGVDNEAPLAGAGPWGARSKAGPCVQRKVSPRFPVPSRGC